MSQFDDDTRVMPLGPTEAGAFTGQVHAAWNIGHNPNGGYLLALAAQALRQRTPAHPDPLSITVHYLRPGLPGQPCRIDTQLLRSGRTLSTVRATLSQDGSARLELLAAMGHLGAAEAAAPPRLAPPAPGDAAARCLLAALGPGPGVQLPILQRLDLRLHPDDARPGAVGAARLRGWVRFIDGREPDALSCLLMCDAFPPAVFGLFGLVGWVPTIELTVHLRARPAPGWMIGRFSAQDLADGRVIEDGALWDASGRLVAQSRQLALVRQP